MAALDANGNIQALNTFGAQGLVSRHTTATNASVFYTFDERGNLAHLNTQPPSLTPKTRRLCVVCRTHFPHSVRAGPRLG